MCFCFINVPTFNLIDWILVRHVSWASSRPTPMNSSWSCPSSNPCRRTLSKSSTRVLRSDFRCENYLRFRLSWPDVVWNGTRSATSVIRFSSKRKISSRIRFVFLYDLQLPRYSGECEVWDFFTKWEQLNSYQKNVIQYIEFASEHEVCLYSKNVPIPFICSTAKKLLNGGKVNLDWGKNISRSFDKRWSLYHTHAHTFLILLSQSVKRLQCSNSRAEIWWKKLYFTNVMIVWAFDDDFRLREKMRSFFTNLILIEKLLSILLR